ncbi:protein of unknown function [Methylococcus capsulatus]|uniref:Uncharacterized protein n=1 Tax=Methylococcus capsulatus TaxID=414 RepID=A0AA35XVM1_METCP|nr:protein of unknown function [Methylococcus capsulatus]
MLGMHIGIAGGGKIAHFRVIRSLAVLHPVHQFRDDAVEVHVALAVRVGRQVHRHPVDPGGEVGAVVQVEAAQEILVGLAGAAVLRGQHAGHDLDQFAHPQQGPVLELVLAHHPLRGRLRQTYQVGLAPYDLDRFEADRFFDDLRIILVIVICFRSRSRLGFGRRFGRCRRLYPYLGR